MTRPYAQETPDVDDEPGYLLSTALIASLAGLLWGALAAEQRTGQLGQGASAIWLGAYVMAWGAMFGLSYPWAHKSFFLRGLMWVCLHASRPAGRRMALFYAALAGFVGLMGMFKGLGWIG